MKRFNNFVLIFIFYFILIALYISEAQIIKSNETKLKDFIPQKVNGEKGITLQYRNANGDYIDLQYINDYHFGVFDNSLKLPSVVLIDSTIGRIKAHPTQKQLDRPEKRDPIIKVPLNGNYGKLIITGNCFVDNTGDVRFYIYLNESNYNNPIWQTNNIGSFNLEINYNEGDNLYFATDAGDSDFYDWAMWENITFKTICNLPSFELSGVHPICKGDTAKVSVNPNDSQYKYKWSNGSTNNTCYITELGNYQVVISNEFDCSDTLDFHIDMKPTFNTKVDSTISKIGSNDAKLHFTSFFTGPVNIDTLQVLYEIRFNANAFLPKDDSSYVINKIDENGFRILQLYYEKFNFSNKDTINLYIEGTLLLGYNKINEVYVVPNTNIQNNICINTTKGYIIADSVCSFETRRIKLIDLLDITLFPNPATNELKIKLKNLVDKQYNIEVYNSNGFIFNTYQIFNTFENEQFLNIDLTYFNNGIYCVLLKSKDVVLQKMFSVVK